jgi:hypothetical protein
MRRDLSCGVAVCFILVFISSPAETAWCAKPSAPPENEAAAKALVRRALESEVAGDAESRRDLLKQALEAAPDYPPANWHSGRVEVDGRWVTLDEAAQLTAVDEQLARYRQLRDEALGNAKRELTLARWCARARLDSESKLHYMRLLDANGADHKARAEAMRVLGLRNIGGRLISDEDVKHQREVAKRIQQSMNRWRPKLRAWQPVIDGPNDKKREYAIEQVEKIDDPDVIPVLETFLFEGGPQFGGAVVRLLAKYPQWEATQTLARFVVVSKWPPVRQEAIRALERRPMHEYVPLFLRGLVSPIQTQWHIATGPDGAVRYQHHFFRAGPGENYAMKAERVAFPVPRVADVVRVPVGPYVDPTWGPDDPAIAVDASDDEEDLETLTSLLDAAERERAVELTNAKISINNVRFFTALEQTTGKFHKREPAAWWDWWQKYNEVYAQKPTRYLYQSSQSFFVNNYRVYYTPMSCFVAGTKVWTQRGRVPIETIKIGDRVLSQDPDTGELAFKLVLNTTLRPPSPMIKVTVDGEDIITTLGHPVWVSEKRWRMAKLLEVSDQLHGTAGILTVDGIDELVPMNQAHNLVIADWATYFVGEKGVLVHDNTYRAPTRALVPGLLPEDE